MSKTSVTDFEKELLLSHFTLENLHEAVFWVDSESRIFRVNDMATKMSGFTKEELLQKKVADLNPSDVVADFKAFWQRLKKENKLTSSTRICLK